jgi:hypothetical protein
MGLGCEPFVIINFPVLVSGMFGTGMVGENVTSIVHTWSRGDEATQVSVSKKIVRFDGHLQHFDCLQRDVGDGDLLRRTLGPNPLARKRKRSG